MYNEDRAREDKVEKADEKMIIENGSRRRGAIKESGKRQRGAPKGGAKNKNEKMDIRLTQRGEEGKRKRRNKCGRRREK